MAASESPVVMSGEKTVTTAGTAVALHSSRRVKALTVIAKSSNTGRVYVGGADVSSATNEGLGPGETISFEAVTWLDLADIYIDADNNGEGVDFYAVKA